MRFFYSRKFWLAVFALVQAIVLHYLNVPAEIWQAIAAWVGVIILYVALDDATAKAGGTWNPEEKLRRMFGAAQFWLALFGIIETLAHYYLAIPEDIWQALSGLILTVIAGATAEDMAENRAAVQISDE